MGFAFMLTASSESDQLTNKISSDDDEGGEATNSLKVLSRLPVRSVILIFSP